MNYNPSKNAKILWAAPYCLHDSMSGAAIQMKLIYEQLVQRGYACRVLSALTFDKEEGFELFQALQIPQNKENEWLEFREKNIHYSYLHTKSSVLDDMTRAEENKFYKKFIEIIVQFKPDILFIYGGGLLELFLISECKRRNIKTVLHVPNGNYASYNFPNIDLLLADCQVTADNYFKSSKLNILPMGTFIEPSKVLADNKRENTFITFINPSPEKGVGIFLRLALMARERRPDWKFLVVESRFTWEEVMLVYKQDRHAFTNVTFAKHTTNIKLVYEKTKLLLVPSVWYEAFGRVATEAIMNGIPVISSRSGGLPTAVNNGGMSITTPTQCSKDYLYIPTEEEVQNWFDAMEEILDEKNYAHWEKTTFEASKAHSLEKSTDTLISHLDNMYLEKASVHPQYFLK